MRKIALLIFAAFLLLMISISSCVNNNQQNTVSSNTELPLDSSFKNEDYFESSETIIIYYPILTSGTDTFDELRERIFMPREIEIEWENQLQELCGRAIDIRCIDINREEIPEKGFVYIRNSSELIPLILGDKITPLNYFRVLVEGFDSLDFEAYMAFTDEAGKIWAIPSANSSILAARWYDSELIDKINKKIPEDIYELETFTIKAKEILEEKNIYLFGMYDLNSMMVELSDIFRAFGCFTEFRSSNIAYNFVEGEYYDIAFTDEFKSAMGFVKDLIEKEVVLFDPTADINSINENNLFISGHLAHNMDDSSFSYKLIGPNTERVISVLPTASGFAVLKGTEGIDDKLNFVINNMYINKELIDELRLGVRGYHYSIENGEIKMLKDTQGRSLMKTPIFASILISNEIKGQVESGKMASSEYDLFWKTLVKENFGNIHYQLAFNKAAYMDIYPDIEKINLDQTVNEIYSNFYQLVQEILLSEKHIDDAIYDYGLRCQRFEYSDYFEWLNSD